MILSPTQFKQMIHLNEDYFQTRNMCILDFMSENLNGEKMLLPNSIESQQFFEQFGVELARFLYPAEQLADAVSKVIDLNGVKTRVWATFEVDDPNHLHPNSPVLVRVINNDSGSGIEIRRKAAPKPGPAAFSEGAQPDPGPSFDAVFRFLPTADEHVAYDRECDASPDRIAGGLYWRQTTLVPDFPLKFLKNMVNFVNENGKVPQQGVLEKLTSAALDFISKL